LRATLWIQTAVLFAVGIFITFSQVHNAIIGNLGLMFVALGFATAATRELKKIGVRWLDARPGHTESGLATRAVFGTAPNFGAGKTVTEVVSRIIRAIQEDDKDLPSSEF
jgi:hypothetical protein